MIEREKNLKRAKTPKKSVLFSTIIYRKNDNARKIYIYIYFKLKRFLRSRIMRLALIRRHVFDHCFRSL